MEVGTWAAQARGQRGPSTLALCLVCLDGGQLGQTGHGQHTEEGLAEDARWRGGGLPGRKQNKAGSQPQRGEEAVFTTVGHN